MRRVAFITMLIGGPAGVLATPPANDLGALSDEFDDPASMGDWGRVFEAEQWGADQLELWDVDGAQPGRMVVMPFTTVWYQNWRGPLVFKEVTGDFVITTKVNVTGRDGVSIPQSAFSLGGIMIRAPRDVTPETWTPGGENYVFLSLGHGGGDSANHYEFEVKTTRDSVSDLTLTPAEGGTALLQTARLGDYVIVLLRQTPGPWRVHRRYHRDDFPGTLQVGFTVYTDWNKAGSFDPWVHNSTVLTPPLPPGVVDPEPERPFNPDIIAAYEFARFFRPTLPPELVGVDLTDETLVSDAALLAFLGRHANVRGPIGRDARPEPTPGEEWRVFKTGGVAP